MEQTYEITNGTKTMVVGLKTIEGGILRRGFHLTDEKLEAKLKADEPYLFPSDDDELKETVEPPVTQTTDSKVPVKEPAKDVNQVVKDPVVPEPKPDFEHALTLEEADLDKYAAKFGCKLDGRNTLDTMRTDFAEFCGVEWIAPTKEVNSELPDDLLCPHCGTKARTEKSYRKNHGDKCFRALTVK